MMKALPGELDSVSSHQLTGVANLRQVIYSLLTFIPTSMWIIMVTLEVAHVDFS